MRLSILRLPSVASAGPRSGVPVARAPLPRMSSAILVALIPGLHVLNALAAPPLPNGGQFVVGTGTIAQNGANLNITQLGSRGIIEWTGFSIGVGRTVSINNGAGATLNRVTGNDVSAIYGTLNVTGSAWLINPHGVLIGPSGVVSTGGRFVASTLDVTNDAFDASYQTLFTGKSNADVVNLGRIGSSGGDVFLISANKVTNGGRIEAPNGSVELVSGRTVSLVDSTFGRQVGVAVGSGGTVTNSGTVQAALISLEAADGNIFALAGHSGALRATGTAKRGGQIWLVAESGTVDARDAQISARNADGTGGSVDVTARTVSIGGAHIDAKELDITAADFTADAATAGTLSASLSGGASVTVNADGADGKFGANGEGNIDVQSNVRWNGASTLQLKAAHSLTIEPQATIANTGTGSLKLYADAHGYDKGGSVINRGTIDWSRSTGIVTALYDMNGSYASGTVRTNPSWRAAPFTGLLTQYTAYKLVNSVADLRAVKNDLAGTYALGSSLYLANASDAAGIGTATTPFTGQFDGMGNVPGGLSMSGGTNTGLFGVIGRAGIVRNFVLAESTATSTGGAVGLLAGINEGYMVNVGVQGDVKSTGDASTAAGGMVGVNRGRIEQSWAGVKVEGAGKVGGLAGQNDGYIRQSFADGSATAGTRGTLGGLVGSNNGRITQSYADSSLTGGAVIGGLVGTNMGGICQSYAESTLKPASGSKAGGLAGFNGGRIAPNVFWNSESSGAAAGVGSGTAMAKSSGLTGKQIGDTASYGPTWNFSATGAWSMPSSFTGPFLRWFYGS